MCPKSPPNHLLLPDNVLMVKEIVHFLSKIEEIRTKALTIKWLAGTTPMQARFQSDPPTPCCAIAQSRCTVPVAQSRCAMPIIRAAGLRFNSQHIPPLTSFGFDSRQRRILLYINDLRGRMSTQPDEKKSAGKTTWH